MADAASTLGVHAPVTAAPPPRGAHAPPLLLRGHIPTLDGLRGIAVLLVMLLHFVGNTTATNRFEALVVYVLGHGMLGVELFFVLSGFLITGILYDGWQKPHYYRNFYVRRTLRIFPLYYGTLLVLLVLVPLLPGVQSTALDGIREDQVWAWFYGVNVLHALRGEWAMTYVNHFWSLAIEEQFYLLWPLVVGTLRSRPRVLLWTSLGISVSSYAGNVAANMFGSPTLEMLTPFQFHGLALGGFIAVLARQPGGMEGIVRWLPRLGVLVGGALVASFLWNRISDLGHGTLQHLRPAMFVGLLACLLMWAVTTRRDSLLARFLTNRTMIFFGTYSYGLYVFHHFISYYFVRHQTEFLLAEWLGSHTAAVLLQASIGSALSIVIAYVSYHAFEKRFLALKDRFAS